MTLKDFLDLFIKNAGIKVEGGQIGYDEFGGFHICLDRGSKYTDLDHLNENDLNDLEEVEFGKFSDKYSYLLEEIKAFGRIHDLVVHPCFGSSDKGHFYIEGRVVANIDLFSFVSNITCESIDQLINLSLKDGDGFTLSSRKIMKKSGEFSIEIYSTRKGEKLLADVFHYSLIPDGKLRILNYPIKKEVSISEIEDSIKSLGEFSAFKVSTHYKNMSDL